jgi:K(+)-stimulated pyrophosphate-energized sodium pump
VFVNTSMLANMQDVVDHASVWFLAPAGAVVALIMAFYFSRTVMARSEGDEGMVEIAEAVRNGAMAYLRRQYKVVALVFVALVAVLLLLGFLDIQPIWTAVGVPIAGIFSGLCGWFGMKMATNASARTTFAAKNSLNDGLTVAFRSGAVMGLVVVGFALLDASAWFYVWNLMQPEDAPTSGWMVTFTAIMLSYGMGASTQALFARVGGGIFTKAADVGADLVGKVEAGIPEDDPRNPATIADNVGDNVGDVAGMGADLYESYYGSILATMALGAAAAMVVTGLHGDESMLAVKLVAAPMSLAGLGIFCSLVGIFVVRAKENASFSQLLKGLHMGVYAASVLIAGLSLLLFMWLFEGTVVHWWQPWGAIVTGLASGLVIAYATEYYTSYEHKPTQSIAEQSQTGPATVIIAGIAEGMKSTWVPLVVIVIAIMTAFSVAGGGEYFLMGLYGVGIAAVGMLSTLGITLATDAYGPIADNAGGNAEMTGQPAFVRERTDMLDSLGNTTAATGKGFAIGSAALTALALMAAYISIVQNALHAKLNPSDEVQQMIVDTAGTPEGDQIAAHYHGNGEFSMVLSDGSTTGGLMLAHQHTKTKFDSGSWLDKSLSFDATWNKHVNAYDVHIEDMEFEIVPTSGSRMNQISSFYDISIMNPRVLSGVFLGVMLAFVFCALTMSAVGRAAYQMMNECRRQFAIMKAGFKKSGMSDADVADPTNWPKKIEVDGHMYPDYAACVDISTAGAQREMIIPSILAIVAPVAVGMVLGVGGVMGLLVGGLTSGFAMAIFMANAGGAWDNAKKYIESGKFGGKGSESHKAGVVGDTVGDPFKDTSGPSLNILVKLIAIVSVVFAGLVVNYGPTVSSWLGIN